MAETVIRVEGLGKMYQIGAARRKGEGLRHAVEDGVRRLGRRLRGRNDPRPATENFWALKDVSFEVRRGECVGVIGRNGAGKSTLLKILSRITEPTVGEVGLKGRVGSLLEVGTGFHAELTGRENIFLNGAILGMSRREITKKFDDIVAFSEVEQFLDTPVKRYSSGMYVRLAFAVAAHLEPEILIVDEVLAVGDATFQKRCLDRMSHFAAGGRTVLFVSHNLQIVTRLCRSAVRLAQGRLVDAGQADDVVRGYLVAESTGGHGDLRNKTRTGTGEARFTRAWLVGANGEPAPEHRAGDDLRVRFEIETTAQRSDVALAVIVQNAFGLRVITSWNREVGFRTDLPAGNHAYECHFKSVPLRAGHTIVIGLWVASSAGDTFDHIENALTLDVLPGLCGAGLSSNPDQGVVVCPYDWRALGSGEEK